MVGPPTASFTPRSPYWYSLSPFLFLSPFLSFALRCCQLLSSTGWPEQTNRERGPRPTGTAWQREKEREGETKDGYVETRREGGEERYQGFPHLHRQCLTSVAVARPPRDESITLNNVNVSPSQHKTNNHCSLPRPMGMASTRGSPVPHSPLASLVSTPLASSNTDPRLLFFSFCFSARASDLVYVASLKSRRSSSRTYALSRERRWCTVYIGCV